MELAFSDILGKHLLVGISYYTHDNQLIEQKQFHGTVIQANDQRIVLRLANGEEFGLPPDLRSTRRGSPGEYRLRSTGEIVTNPDFLSTWNVTKGEPGESRE